MSKTITQAIQAANVGGQQPGNQGEEQAVARLFMLFHGWWGNLFLSKFITGEKNEAGKDRGILSAMAIWAHELRRFAPEVVVAASERLRAENMQFPPSLPQFVAYCQACQPRKTWTETQPALTMSDDLRAARSKAARDEAMGRLRQKNRAQLDLASANGIPALHQLIAKASADAGGDEAATLSRLDRAFAGQPTKASI